jgi:hypothetical protein
MVKPGLFILAIALLINVSLLADTPAQPALLMRVDQAVGDIDKLSTSLRTIEPGLHVPTQLPALFVPVANPTDSATYTTPLAGPVPYYRMAPGFRARFDRLNYIIVLNPKRHLTAENISPIADGQYIEFAPANMVYELSPLFPSITTLERETNGPKRPHTSEPKDQMEHRLPLQRIENRIDTRIEPANVGQKLGPQR